MRKKQRKIFIILIMAFVIILMLVYIIINRLKAPTSPNDFRSIKQVVEYMGSTYIKEEGTSSKKITVQFKYPLYNEDKTSNETYFQNMINLIANVNNYKNFSLVDNEKNIQIKVKCDTDNNSISSIDINGNSNYFADMDTNNAIDEYTQINSIDIVINSILLNNVLKSNWLYSESIFGTKDSYYDNYNIFFDEGINVKVVSNGLEEDSSKSVFNIVFNSKYKSNIISGLSTSSTLNEVVSNLGQPQFGSIENGLIGYKTSEFYIFFNLKNEVSIYRLQYPETSEFSKIVGEFITSKNSDKFLSDLVYAWPNYDSYIEDSQFNSQELLYTLFGVKIQFNVSNEQGIILYNNFSGNLTETINFSDILNKNKSLPDNVYVKNTDLVYENENARTFYYIDTQFMKQTDNFIAYVIPNVGSDTNNIKFISKTDNYPNSELSYTVNTYDWIDNNRFVYSIKNKGIYIYNVVTTELDTVIEGNDTFEIKKYENGVLSYDNKEINI